MVSAAAAQDRQSARAEAYSKLFHIGAITINEIRSRENLNPIEGGDQVFVPANVVPLDAVGQEPPRRPSSRTLDQDDYAR